MLQGIFPILQTSFSANGLVDDAGMQRQVDFCLASRVSGVVFPANASEFFCLTDLERTSTARLIAERVAGHAKVILCVSGVSAQHAEIFARQAAEIDADAVMALPPYIRRCRLDTIIAYYSRIAEASSLPLIVQNAPPPLGTPIDDAGLDRLLKEVPAIRYIKEERSTALQRIALLTRRYGDRLDGVFGGSNGQWLVEEARRGAVGCMPASALADLQVRIQQLIDHGEWVDAADLQSRIQPLLAYASHFGVAMVKELMFRRGILDCPDVRDPEAPALEDVEIDHLLELVDVARLPEVPMRSADANDHV